ncbi:Y1252-like protein [Mya arenaria]|uniref:Y1252-like protein n=1 Tax=Mya arenaria TaxID=6604 RepID=A0ABY7FQ02_MYAAR|nr:Y1252-like protein [Mya arenaria]
MVHKGFVRVPEMSYYLCADNKDDLGQIAEDVQPHMLEVHIRNGTLIPDQKADISVNTTGKSLQLEKGGALSRSIVLAAGVQLQDELSKEYPGGLNEGQIAVTSSGKLSRNGVHEIIHCVLPKFDKEKFDDDIKAMVKTCLAEADKLQGKSIALPPFGTGRHGYPIRKTALAMFEAIDEFSEESVGMTLQTTYIPTLEDEHCKVGLSFFQTCTKSYLHFISLYVVTLNQICS